MEDPRTKRLRRMLYQATKLQQTTDRLLSALEDQLDGLGTTSKPPRPAVERQQPRLTDVEHLTSENIG